MSRKRRLVIGLAAGLALYSGKVYYSLRQLAPIEESVQRGRDILKEKEELYNIMKEMIKIDEEVSQKDCAQEIREMFWDGEISREDATNFIRGYEIIRATSEFLEIKLQKGKREAYLPF